MRDAAVPSNVETLNRRRDRVVRVPAGELLQGIKKTPIEYSAGWEITETQSGGLRKMIKKKAAHHDDDLILDTLRVRLLGRLKREARGVGGL